MDMNINFVEKFGRERVKLKKKKKIKNEEAKQSLEANIKITETIFLH